MTEQEYQEMLEETRVSIRALFDEALGKLCRSINLPSYQWLVWRAQDESLILQGKMPNIARLHTKVAAENDRLVQAWQILGVVA